MRLGCFLAVGLGFLLTSLPVRDARACSCADQTSIASASPDGLHALNDPIVVVESWSLGDLELMDLHGRPVPFDEVILRTDTTCAPGYRVLSPRQDLALGESVIVSSMHDEQRMDRAEERRPRLGSPLTLQAPRPLHAATVDLQLSWTELTPEDPATDLCRSPALDGLVRYGVFYATARSDRPSEFYLRMVIELSNGQTYESVARASSSAHEGEQGFRVLNWVPATSPQPPCVQVQLLDQGLRQLWSSTECPPFSAIEAETLFHDVLDLPDEWTAEQAPAEVREGGGCAWSRAPLQPVPWPLLFTVFCGLALAHRLRRIGV